MNGLHLGSVQFQTFFVLSSGSRFTGSGDSTSRWPDIINTAAVGITSLHSHYKEFACPNLRGLIPIAHVSAPNLVPSASCAPEQYDKEPAFKASLAKPSLTHSQLLTSSHLYTLAYCIQNNIHQHGLTQGKGQGSRVHALIQIHWSKIPPPSGQYASTMGEHHAFDSGPSLRLLDIGGEVQAHLIGYLCPFEARARHTHISRIIR
jgi:hypothetical protein